MPVNKNNLIEALKRANEAAISADPGPDDDAGTCNFDSPAIKLPRMRNDAAEQVSQITGVRLAKFSAWGSGWFWVLVDMRGQGNRRTKMMEAALKVLKELQPDIGNNVKVAGYYQMD